MTETIRRQLELPHSREDVWRALTDSAVLGEWMYPNDFEPRRGHQFTFRVPPNPRADFDGTVRCEVLQCKPSSELTYSWAGGNVVGTRVDYRLESNGTGTRVTFEHAGFDLTQPWGEQALRGAEYGWDLMLKRLADMVSKSVAQH
jgi:uncharacterized protein YndB with AHSA1/START domain